jgi:hypothetical protein
MPGGLRNGGNGKLAVGLRFIRVGVENYVTMPVKNYPVIPAEVFNGDPIFAATDDRAGVSMTMS